MGLGAYFRLARAGFVLAREGALSIADNDALPPVMKAGVRFGRLFERGEVRRSGNVERLTRALHRLGPTYVKLGQTLATRPDIVGPAAAADLAVLQDSMEPFDPALVPGLLHEALGARAAELTEFSPPIAAASIAQVHHARLADGTKVAVKILRPGIRQRFAADIESQYAGARLAETFVPKLRRLRPVDVVATLDRSARIELDLRLEAASISEFTDNIKDDTGFVIPRVLWDYTSDTVLTTTWVEGIPIRDNAALDAAGVDRKALAKNLLQAFLRHTVRDGFFHADLHPGNLFADPRTGDVIAVDFGIMGRITRRERRFLAEILYGFITRNYRLIAERHFEIGYVPRSQSIDEFALALRAIGEPQHGRRVSEISMSKVLGQLFATTELFEMQTRPELILLQKSMVLVEGVARALDPELDIWTISEPIVGDWVRRSAGPLGRLEDLRDHFDTAVATLGRLPAVVSKAEAALDDYEHDKHAPGRRFNRFMILTGFWLGLVVLLTALWRLLGF
ncbi:MAG: 2-polyprenylphenol 6-hydroxylase [Devosia sp.]|uniref:2-polyprenylphenol 6-hydroxylase n=1 Tax=Devosia sp. TaxID=1871048 RepID=UPI001AD124A1|nr:2-polyprenylphenol 6-hydroxylase [Devosia sp.]MBN9315850.1 2-polyprenylphenol 6-hydroxylase [Devosia sp.]